MTKLRVLFAHMRDNLSGMQTRFHPLWPAYLAASVESHFGQETMEFRLASDDAHFEIALFKPHIVAIGAVSSQFNDAIDWARISKQYGLATIIGGIHISLMPQCLTKDMDVGCIGEGEETFCDLLVHFLKYGSFVPKHMADIKGIVYRDDGKLIRTSARSLIKPFDQIPHPKRALVGYQRHDYLLGSRGCPYKCAFCSGSVFWGKPRFASAAYILEEIKGLVLNGVKIIRFEDDSLTTNVVRLRKIKELITAQGLNQHVQFNCWARANEVTVEVVEYLKAMNVNFVWMGLESGCQRTLDYLKGNVTVDQNRRAVTLLSDAGIQTNGFFVIGSPYETEEEVLQTYKFIKESRLDFVTINILTPLPGTTCWDYWTEKNPIVDDMDWGQLFHMNTEFSTNIILSETLTYEKLKQIYKKFERLAQRKKLMAHLKKLRLSEFPRIASEMQIMLRRGFNKFVQ